MKTMICSQRLKSISRILLVTDDYITSKEISEKLGISKRTVMRELSNTENFYRDFGLELFSKSGNGYKLIGTQEEKESLYSYLQDEEDSVDYSSADNRREKIISEILKERSIAKVSYYSYVFGVSEGTISNDIKVIEEYLKDKDIHIERKQGIGITITGSESSFHKAKADFLHRQMVKRNVEQYIQRNINFDETGFLEDSKIESRIMDLLDKDILFKVITVLKNISLVFLGNINQSSYLGLIIHLTIAIDRIQKDQLIEMDKMILDNLKKDSMYFYAEEFVRRFELEFNISFPEEETAYVLMHIKGTRLKVYEQNDWVDINTEYQCTHIAELLVEKFSGLMGIDFTADEELFAGLMAHLKPAVNRIRFDLEIRNPLLDQIKTQFSEVFEITQQACESICSLFDGKHFDEHEIGYLSLHFGAAIERKNAVAFKNIDINAGVICTSGVGISVLLSSSIRSTFPELNKVKPLSIQQLDEPDGLKGLDIIISTLNITGVDLPVVYVSPLLNDSDIDKIRSSIQKIYTYKQQYFVHDHNIVKEPIAVNYDTITNMKVKTLMGFYKKNNLIQLLLEKIPESAIVREICYHAVLDRDKWGEVKLPDKNFVLYHANVFEIKKPYVVVFRFHEPFYLDDKGTKIVVGLLMLLPKPTAKAERVILSNLSRLIMETEDFIDVMKKDRKDKIIDYVMTKFETTDFNPEYEI